MKRKILIVDDSPAILELLENFLTRQGFTVYKAANGEEAINLIRKSPIPVVFTDIKMPIMNGIELIEKIKSTYPMIRVIIGTGYVNFKYGLSAFTNGAETILFKPYDLSKLKKTIDRAFKFLDQWEVTLKELQEFQKEKETLKRGDETILFVDDNEKATDFARFNLVKQGYEFLVAKTGREAMELVAETTDPPDLLITSVKLEDMYGKELYKHLKNSLPNLKILYLVSYREEIIFEDNVLHENDNYIYYPFTKKILLKMTRNTLDGQL